MFVRFLLTSSLVVICLALVVAVVVAVLEVGVFELP